MDLTSSTRATATMAATAMLGGLAGILYGIAHDNLPRSIGGLALTMTGLTALALTTIRRWVTNTSSERTILAAAQREAQARKDCYLTAQAALENEQGRLTRDMAAERASLAVRLQVERDAMATEFEERRAALIAETMEATVRMVHDGRFAPSQHTTGNLIQFPHQHPQSERQRSREHGVVGP